MPSTSTKPRMRFFALSAVAGLDDADDEREEQAGYGSRARGDGDRHVETAPVKPGGARGDRRANAANGRGEQLIVAVVEPVGTDDLHHQEG